MQHADILSSHDVDQFTGLNMPNLDEVGLKRQDVRIGEGEGTRVALPRNPPVWTSSPSISVDKEGEITVVQKELSVQSLNVNRLDVLLARDEIK